MQAILITTRRLFVATFLMGILCALPAAAQPSASELVPFDDVMLDRFLAMEENLRWP